MQNYDKNYAQIWHKTKCIKCIWRITIKFGSLDDLCPEFHFDSICKKKKTTLLRQKIILKITITLNLIPFPKKT